ncbi:MAG: hypothetical protein ACI9OJ_005695 [Myxococcota bacterium]|jgi:hypothetical protein
MTDLEAFRRGLAEIEPRGATESIPIRLRQLALRHLAAQRQAGIGWIQVSAELGICTTTLRRWSRANAESVVSAPMASPQAPRALTPVPVVVAREATPVSRSVPVLVSPGGYRLEGLDAGAAVALFERLR